MHHYYITLMLNFCVQCWWCWGGGNGSLLLPWGTLCPRGRHRERKQLLHWQSLQVRNTMWWYSWLEKSKEAWQLATPPTTFPAPKKARYAVTSFRICGHSISIWAGQDVLWPGCHQNTVPTQIKMQQKILLQAKNSNGLSSQRLKCISTLGSHCTWGLLSCQSSEISGVANIHMSDPAEDAFNDSRKGTAWGLEPVQYFGTQELASQKQKLMPWKKKREGALISLKWMDTREVSVCSTLHTAFLGNTVKRVCKVGGKHRAVRC